ncbi:MAG: hypothetical protein AAFN07_13675 [Pseudomonadota bacterium]
MSYAPPESEVESGEAKKSFGILRSILLVLAGLMTLGSIAGYFLPASHGLDPMGHLPRDPAYRAGHMIGSMLFPCLFFGLLFKLLRWRVWFGIFTGIGVIYAVHFTTQAMVS